jgi:peroxiredoxin Q/BCP
MRLTVGMKAPSFVAESIEGCRVELAARRGRTLLLKFYRFATCPVCNWHMKAFIHDYGALEQLGLETIVFFHSPGEKVHRTHRHVAPFDIVGDPTRRIFTAFGVERSWAGMFSLSVWGTYVRAMAAGFGPGMLTADGGMDGLPADFIIDGDGRIAYAHYGSSYVDALDVPRVLAICRGLKAQPTPLHIAAGRVAAGQLSD